MKPPPFEYATPTSIEEALDVLGREEDASPLAGGQSLVPLLNMRMALPGTVVDLNHVDGLDEIEISGDRVRIGAMVRQHRLETDPGLLDGLPLLGEAARHVAHVAIRTRGTVGGSLAHADPAAELPATVAALHGRMLVRSGDGEVAIPAGEFFLGPLTSALEPGQLLVGLELEHPPRGTGSAFLEVARTHGAFALTAAAAMLRVDADGTVGLVRLGLAGVGSTPYVPDWLEDAVIGEIADPSLFERVGARIGEEIKPYDDIHATAGYRRKAAAVLAARSLALAAGRSESGGSE